MYVIIIMVMVSCLYTYISKPVSCMCSLFSVNCIAITLFFSKDLFIIYLFYLFLAASGLSCGTWDLC